MTDTQFAKAFFQMIIYLVVLAIVLMITGAFIGGSLDEKLETQREEFTQRVIAQRTQPVGTLNVGAIPAAEQPASPMMTAEPTSSAESEPLQVASADHPGAGVYNSGCQICHNTGVTGAPKPGDVDNWAPRIARGIDTLYSNAINGYQGESGVMPPKGGLVTLSDEDVKAAVDYMVSTVQ